MSQGREGVEAPSARQRRTFRWLLLLVFTVAALLYATVWQLPAILGGRAADGFLVLSRLEGGEWVEMQDGVEVPALSRMRFAVRLRHPASVVLIGLSEGRAKLYVPTSGNPPRFQEGTSSVGEAALDGIPGPELFLAELCNTPLSQAVILKAAERAAAAAGEPGRVQTLDLGCPEARFLVHKASPGS
jgi:hypothetical protein